MQMRSKLEAARVAASDASAAADRFREDSCTSSSAGTCTHKKVKKDSHLAQQLLYQQEQRTKAAERNARHCQKGTQAYQLAARVTSYTRIQIDMFNLASVRK